MAARGRQYWSDSKPRGKQTIEGEREEKTHDIRSEEVEDRRARRYESPAGDGVRPRARQKLRLRDRRRRIGGLRGRAPPPRRHRRHRSPTPGGAGPAPGSPPPPPPPPGGEPPR